MPPHKTAEHKKSCPGAKQLLQYRIKLLKAKLEAEGAEVNLK